MQGAAQQGAQLRQIDRLAQIVERTLTHGGHCRIHGAIGGHDDHRQLRLFSAQPRQRLQAVQARHPHVQEHRVRALAPGQVQRFPAAGGDQRRMAFQPQELGEGLADGGFVVGDQHLAHDGFDSGAGSQTRNHAPPRSLSATSMRPPWRAAISRHSGKPSPSPSGLRL